MVDVLFVTRMSEDTDQGDPEVYRPLRLLMDGRSATIPRLRASAGERSFASHASGTNVPMAPPVLTPIFMREFLMRRGFSFEEIPCLQTDAGQLEKFASTGVGVVALSTTWTDTVRGAEEIREAAARIRKVLPGTPIIVGGTGILKSVKILKKIQDGSFPEVPEDVLHTMCHLLDADRDRDVDAFALAEDSERTLIEILRKVKAGEEFRNVDNLAIPAPGGFRFTANTSGPIQLEEGVDWRNYAHLIARGMPAPIRSAVGCPFKCEFCDFIAIFDIRVRSMPSLMAELETLRGLPDPRRVIFVDENLGLNRKKLKDLAHALIKAKLRVSWRGFMRADIIDRDIAAMLRESGCQECLLGIESGDPTVLDNMKKHLDPERSIRAIEYLDAEGISTQSTLVIGFPGECQASIERTAAFLSAYPSGPSSRALHRYYLFRFGLTPLCGASSPENRARFKLSGLGDQWSHYSMDAEGAKHAMKACFENVRGPTMMYHELPPVDWPLEQTRQVMEARDKAQKLILKGQTPRVALDGLLGTVRSFKLDAPRSVAQVSV